jgi:hypothetical protein
LILFCFVNKTNQKVFDLLCVSVVVVSVDVVVTTAVVFNHFHQAQNDNSAFEQTKFANFKLEQICVTAPATLEFAGSYE